MLRLLMLLSSCLYLTQNISASEYQSSGRIAFTKTFHNFKKVYRGQLVSYVFKFKNTGKGPVSISGIHRSCGCQVVTLDNAVDMAPGSEGSLELGFLTSNFVGKVRKTLTLMTSTRSHPIVLTIQANIEAEYEVSPPLVDFGLSNQDVYEIEFIPKGSFPLEIQDIIYNKDLFDLKAEKKSNKWLLKLSRREYASFSNESIRVLTNSVHLPEQIIPVRMDPAKTVVSSANYLDFGALSINDSVKKVFKVYGDFELDSFHSAFKIENPLHVEGQDLVEVKVLEKTVKYTSIEVTLQNFHAIRGSAHGQLYLKNKKRLNTDLSIDLYGFFL